jgi:uncharacterized protein (DUF2147 family)
MAALAASAWAATPPTGLGHWITETGNYEVEIAPCADKLCGTIVQVLGNRSMRDPSLEMVPADPRPALGMKILMDLTPTGDGAWSGSVYNRENGKTYSCVVTLLETGQLKVRGYVGLPLFGQTSIWRRP